ncbi:MAG: hypothetical protein LBQ79_00460 [Deltaproteobacteria bacterium]|nr:hypothetical protein [Deltaproteobacteria bacterium]
MPCGPVEIIVGGTLEQVKLLNPGIVSPTVTGGIDADGATLQGLAEDLQPRLKPYPTPADILKELKSCDGLSLAPGSKVVTCAELDQALECFSPEKILGEISTCSGGVLAPGAAVPTCAEMTAAIAAASAAASADADPAKILGEIGTCGGGVLAPGATVPTCAEMEEAIASATEPAKIAGVFENDEGNPLSPGTTLLSKNQIIALILAQIGQYLDDHLDDLIKDAVDGAGFLKAGITGSVPAQAPGSALPSTVYGARTALMGAPVGYMPVAVGASSYLVPLYGG